MAPTTPTEPNAPTPPTASFLKRVENASLEALAKLLGIPEKPEDEKVVELTEEQEARLREIERNAIVRFQGDLPQLESALGMLRLGYYMGWQVLYLIHSKKTVRTYEEILGIRIREEFPPDGPSSYRSIGLNLAIRFGNFWRVAGGDIKIPRRQDTL